MENFKIALKDIFKAYYDCRKNKRKTKQQLEFEYNLEENCIQLHNDIITGKYKIQESICFIITKPKPREVFAASFRDRIVHHLIINKLNKLFEQEFISNTFNCRKKKGVLCGVKQLQEDIRKCSNNFTKPCYIAKFDFKNFFMSINKPLLWKMLRKFIKSKYKANDINCILFLVKQLFLIVLKRMLIREVFLSFGNY